MKMSKALTSKELTANAKIVLDLWFATPTKLTNAASYSYGEYTVT